MTAIAVALFFLILFLLKGCEPKKNNPGGEGVSFFPLWVYIDKSNLPSVAKTFSIDLSGSASCDACPSGDTAFGFCPPIQPTQSSAISITYSNLTTGVTGGTWHGIGGSCSCLFSYCFTSYSHRWQVVGLPLAIGDNVIEIKAYDAKGNSGTDTITITRVHDPYINNPTGIAIDTVNDEVFVASCQNSSLLVYARADSGRATPKRVIYGAAANMYCLTGVAVDTINNEIFLTDFSIINVYSRTASEDASPIRTAAATAGGTINIAVDTVNNEIFVMNNYYLAQNISVYSRTASGDAPVRVISGAAANIGYPNGLAVDAANNEIFLADHSTPHRINVYSSSASGDAAPIRTISGPSTGLDFPSGVAVDTVNNEIFVVNSDSVSVYSRTANGDAAPVRVISGASVNIGIPRGIAVDTTNNEIFVLDANGNNIKIYSRTASGDVAPIRLINGGDPGY